ncbi:type II secretion system F family protein [Ramlibacter sp. 2FC]|uniref:type II secretion system F family protein n=1 Tax=Ramlibacter sp. 2FC TaxID=2502188 RepID=UPI0010F9BA80|nr:type II secretion system F family protein [Ramlibacter sp. 2FC]
MNTGMLLFVVLGFVAVVLLLEGSYVLWNDNKSPEVKRIEQRLRAISAGGHDPGDIKLVKERVMSSTPGLHSVLVQLPQLHQLDRLLLQAGSRNTVSHVLVTCAMAAIAGLITAALLRWHWFFMLLLALGLAIAPLLHLLVKRERRMHLMEAQLPDALDLIARALRAGHSFLSALGMVGEEGPEPIAGEFKTVFDEISFGISTENALNDLAKRVPASDLRYFVMAVLIQRETGGNLAELLDNLARLIRERFKLLAKVQVLAAEGKLSAWILTLLPFVVAAAVQTMNPKYLSALYTDPMGIKMVIGALIMIVIGIIAMWRIIEIRV